MSQVFLTRRHTYGRSDHYLSVTNISTSNSVTNVCYTVSSQPSASYLPLIYYSTDRSTWTKFSGYTKVGNYYNSTSVSINAGETLYLRGIKIHTSTDHILITGGDVSLGGLPSALVDWRANRHDAFNYGYLFKNCTAVKSTTNLWIPESTSSQFTSMFEGCSSLTDYLTIPTSSVPNSYVRGGYTFGWLEGMYKGCSSLSSIPSNYVSSFTLSVNCYKEMFSGCSSLTSPVTLPKTQLVTNCYNQMYFGCSQLNTVADYLPFTSFTSGAVSCCDGMFAGCTSLTAVHTLRPTTLCQSCYENMYSGCYALTTLPTLPATTLAERCYMSMFSDCTGITAMTTLGNYSALKPTCFAFMYAGCVNLTTILQSYFTKSSCAHCFKGMFAFCHKLTGDEFTFTLPEPTVSYVGDIKNNSFTHYILNPNRSTTTWLINPAISDSYLFDIGSQTSARAMGETSSSHSYMFAGCTSLKHYNFFKTFTNATRLAGLYAYTFAFCPKLTGITTSDQIFYKVKISTYCFNHTFDMKISTTHPLFSTWSPAFASIPADMFVNGDTSTYDYCFEAMFQGCKSLSVSGLTLPYKTLCTGCYMDMFGDCHSLTTPADLTSVTAISSNAYYCCCQMYCCAGITSISQSHLIPRTVSIPPGGQQAMFSGTSITNLNGIVIDNPFIRSAAAAFNNQCAAMFAHCKQLTTVPSGLLPKSDLSVPSSSADNSCYREMFSMCSALTNTPDLPASILPSLCYKSMFGCTNELANILNPVLEGCRSLTNIPDLSHVTSVGKEAMEFMFADCRGLVNISSRNIGADNATASTYALSGMFCSCTELLFGPTFRIQLSNTQNAIFGAWTLAQIDREGCDKLLYVKFTNSPTTDSIVTKMFSYNSSRHIASAGVLDIPVSDTWDAWCAKGSTTVNDGLPPTWIARPSTTYTWAGMPLGATLWCSDLYDSNSGGSFALSDTKFSIGPTTNLSNLTGWVGTEASPMANTLYAGMTLEFTKPLPNGKLSINPFLPGSTAGTSYNISTPLTFNVDNTAHTITAACDANCSAFEIVWEDGSYSSIPAYPTGATGYQYWTNSNASAMTFGLTLGTDTGKQIGCYTGCTKNSTYYTLYHTFASPAASHSQFDWDISTFFNYLYNLHDTSTYFFSAHSIIVFAHYATVKKPYLLSENPLLDCADGMSMPIASYSLSYNSSTDRYKIIVTQN